MVMKQSAPISNITFKAFNHEREGEVLLNRRNVCSDEKVPSIN